MIFIYPNHCTKSTSPHDNCPKNGHQLTKCSAQQGAPDFLMVCIYILYLM